MSVRHFPLLMAPARRARLRGHILSVSLDHLRKPATPADAPRRIELPPALNRRFQEQWAKTLQPAAVGRAEPAEMGPLPPAEPDEWRMSLGDQAPPEPWADSPAAEVDQDSWSDASPSSERPERFGFIPGREHGGLLVRDAGEVQLVHPVVGEARAIAIEDPYSADIERMGTFHTHPVDQGTMPTLPSFSGDDIASFMKSGDTVSIVQQGDRQFMLVRSEQAAPQEVSATQLTRLIQEEVARLGGQGVGSEQAHQSALDTLSQRYGFAVYSGSGGQLERRSPP